jgi:hypothetical protein
MSAPLSAKSALPITIVNIIIIIIIITHQCSVVVAVALLHPCSG